MTVNLSDAIYFRNFGRRPFVALEESSEGKRKRVKLFQIRKSVLRAFSTWVWIFQPLPPRRRVARHSPHRHDEIAAPKACSIYPDYFPSIANSEVATGCCRWDGAWQSFWWKPNMGVSLNKFSVLSDSPGTLTFAPRSTVTLHSLLAWLMLFWQFRLQIGHPHRSHSKCLFSCTS